jgi:hypothetical protein
MRGHNSGGENDHGRARRFANDAPADDVVLTDTPAEDQGAEAADTLPRCYMEKLRSEYGR